MLCPNCHTSNEDNALYCRGSGTLLQEKSNNKKTLRFIFVIPCIAIVVGIITFCIDENSYSESYPSAYKINTEYNDPVVVESEAVIESDFNVHEPILEELYSQAETIHDLRCLANQGYLPAAYDLVRIFYRDERYEECSQFAYQCIDANYRVDDVREILGELLTCYRRTNYEE